MTKPLFVILFLTYFTLGVMMSGCTVRGPRGETGSAGSVGAPGVGCMIQPIGASDSAPNGGSILTCENSATLILNGTNGTNGQDAPDQPYAIAKIIDPCGKQSAHDEVLLVLVDGTVLAHFSSGGKEFLTLLTVGVQYVTTDGTNCRFKVTASGSIE
jgi:hypothetical protein